MTITPHQYFQQIYGTQQLVVRSRPPDRLSRPQAPPRLQDSRSGSSLPGLDVQKTSFTLYPPPEITFTSIGTPPVDTPRPGDGDPYRGEQEDFGGDFTRIQNERNIESTKIGSEEEAPDVTLEISDDDEPRKDVGKEVKPVTEPLKQPTQLLTVKLPEKPITPPSTDLQVEQRSRPEFDDKVLHRTDDTLEVTDETLPETHRTQPPLVRLPGHGQPLTPPPMLTDVELAVMSLGAQSQDGCMRRLCRPFQSCMFGLRLGLTRMRQGIGDWLGQVTLAMRLIRWPWSDNARPTGPSTGTV